MKTLAIAVGGGPSPGINAVIAAATIEARNHGLRVIGVQSGFRALVAGDLSRARSLDIHDVSRIHFEGGSILGTSRVNPAGTPDDLRRVIESLSRLEVSYLVTIGGDDTAFGAAQVAAAMKGQLATVHVPKTIDNDLPLPPGIPTFGFTTAVNVGKDLVHNLMQDAATAGRWFFVTVMGRHAGHLALGVAGAAGATLAIIPEEFRPEEFPASHLPLERVADILEGAIIKRLADGRDHGVALMAEGLLENLDPATLGPVERDSYGNLRLAELDLGRLLRARVAASLAARGLQVSIQPLDLGYELRCAPPDGFDIQYCRGLGYSAIRFLLHGGSGAMVTVQGERLVPVPFADLMDPATGRIRVRRVDVQSEMYGVYLSYMIRLRPEDFADPERIRALATAGRLAEAEFVRRFRPVAAALPQAAAAVARSTREGGGQ
ncbi:MAG TPA: diphosphate--fructose-6-phosphate 1-phosphotransferase [bacterium]|nr:diphosphate--fructose-6-phosphate 1-phosphotransferase [bacterium]